VYTYVDFTSVCVYLVDKNTDRTLTRVSFRYELQIRPLRPIENIYIPNRCIIKMDIDQSFVREQ
jgi:hypothetical protein